MDLGSASPRLQRRIARWALSTGLATVLFGAWGHAEAGTPLPAHLPLVLYDLAGLLILDAPELPLDAVAYSWPFSIARLLGVCTAALGIAFVVVGLYREGADHVKLRYLAWKARGGRPGHVVVVGLGPVGRQLLRDLCSEEATEDVVVVEQDPANPWVDTYRNRGAVVLLGDVRDATVRARARLDLAGAAFVACGSDAVNVDVAGDIARDLRRDGRQSGQAGRLRPEPLHCYAHVAGPRLLQALRERDLFAEQTEAVAFHTFNVPENAARALLRDPGGLGRPPTTPADDEVAHYVLVGFGTSGQNVALQMARLAHFRNRKRLRLTVVDDFGDDPTAAPAVRSFLDRYPAFCPDPARFDLAAHARSDDPRKDDWTYRGAHGEARPRHAAWRSDDPRAVEYVVNAEFVPMPSEVDAPGLVEALVERLTRDPVRRVRPGAVLCFEEDRFNFEAALRLAAALERERLPMPIYVYLPEEDGLAALLAPSARASSDGRAGAAPAQDLHPFGGQSTSYRRVVRPVIRDLAEALHDAYEDHAEAEREQARHEAAADGHPPPELPAPYERIPFARLHPRFRASNEEAAAHAVLKLDAVGCVARPAEEDPPPGATVVETLSRGEVELLAEVEHNRWVAERLLGGWRFGPEDDARRKRRRTLCAWPHLTDADLTAAHPEEHREKDRVTVRQLVGAFRKARQVVYRLGSGAASSASGGTIR